MPLTLTSSQETNASADATRPLFVIELQHSGGAELLSTGGDVVYDDRSFAAGVRVSSLANTVSASLGLPWTPERMARIQSGGYRGHECYIWYIPAAVDGGSEFDDTDGILLMDGLVRSTAFSGRRIQVDVLHRARREVLVPRVTLDQVTSFAAASGTQIEWDGEIITLEGRR